MPKIGINITLKKSFKEVEFNGCLFRCYESGKMERRSLGCGGYGKEGEWLACDKNKPNRRGYVRLKINYKVYFLHRIVYLAFNPTFDISNPKALIDHIDGDTLNNRIENLREATHAQNLCNAKIQKNNKIGVKNICQTSRYWRVAITKDGKRVVNKSFRKSDYTLDDVITFRNAKLLVHHGEFARLD